jgi:hypothetical protein
MRSVLIVLVTVALVSAGCARYEYDLVSPPQAAGHVGRKDDHAFALDPLEYKLRTVDNRLVVRVYNPTSEHVTLLGGRSVIVGPDGQSHPLMTQTIAPGGSFIKMIIPPPRPRFYGGGTTFGVGVGVGVGHAFPGPHDEPGWYGDDPHYLTVYDESDTYYWDWKGEGQARLNLVYARGEPHREADAARGPTFNHELLIRRVGVK